MTGTQAATALQWATWSKGVNIDKARLYRSEPTQIAEQREPIKMLAALAAEYPKVVQITPSFGSEVVEEIPDPQLENGS